MALFGRRERGPTALPVPPFPPDPPAPPPVTPVVPDDPLALLAAHGVTVRGDVETVQAATDLPVCCVRVRDRDELVRLWQQVRDLHGVTGLWPVLGTAETWERTAQAFDEQPEPVRPLDAVAWFATSGDGESDVLAELPRGATPRWVPPDPSDWAIRLREVPDPLDRLLLVPAPAGWAVPALLGWDGAVNEDVMGSEHTAVLRRFEAFWGAELAVLGPDTLALRVARPPATPELALAAAVEMALYCSDAVHQGVGTVDDLAPMAASSVWWFWWD